MTTTTIDQTTAALVLAAPLTAFYPCPSWCSPELCERRHELETDGRLTEVASHSGPVTVIRDTNGEYDSLHIYLRRCDLNDDTDPTEIAVDVNGRLAGHAVTMLTPAKAREFAATLITLADVAEAVAR